MPYLLNQNQHGWRFDTNPTIAVVEPVNTPTAWTGTAVWQSYNRYLWITVAGSAIAEQTDVDFTIQDTLTPSSISGVKQVTYATFDSNTLRTDANNQIDTDAITAGTLFDSSSTNAMEILTGTDTPGVISTATVSFSAYGKIETSGRIKIVFPQVSSATVGGGGTEHDWRNEGTSPSISFSQPAGASASSSWSDNTRTLTVYMSTDIGTGAASTDVVFTVGGVKTPSSPVAASTATVDTQDSYGDSGSTDG